MWRRSKDYLRKNWGAPFVIAFIVLLIASAGLLSENDSAAANNLAVYAFYALVLGVVLQIVSYVNFGVGNKEKAAPYVPSSPKSYRKWRLGKRTLAVIVIIVLIIAAAAGVYYYKPQTSTHSTSSSTKTTTSTTTAPLSLGIGFIKELPESDNAVQILVGINETGGLQPFNFTASWSDGVNQTNTVGVFIRSFLSNETIPSSIKVVVTSSDGQTASIEATIPTVVRNTSTTTTTSSSSAAFPLVTFIETGLSSGATWSIQLGGSTMFSSNTSKIDFSYPLGDNFSYVISGPYDTQNFKWAFVPSPQSGTVLVNQSTKVNVAFSNVTVLTPTDRLFTVTNPPIATSTGKTSEEIEVNYLNAFPDQVEALVFATVKNNETGSIAITTASIEPLASGEQTALLIFNDLSPGNYTASISVESMSGVLLSPSTSSTFTITG